MLGGIAGGKNVALLELPPLMFDFLGVSLLIGDFEPNASSDVALATLINFSAMVPSGSTLGVVVVVAAVVFFLRLAVPI